MADRSGQPVEKVVTKNDKRRKLEAQMVEFLKRRYPHMAEFATLPQSNGAQTAAFADWKSWIASCWAHLLVKIQEVDDAPQTPESGWRSVALDRETLRLSDPKLKAKDYLRLTDP